MRIILWIVRILAVLLLVRMILRAFFPGRRQQPRDPRGPAKTPERLGGELVKDPNCGTYVPKARAIAEPHGGAVQYFCSTKCRDEWIHSVTTSSR